MTVRAARGRAGGGWPATARSHPAAVSLLLLAALAITWPAPASAEAPAVATLVGIVTRVADGDTVTVRLRERTRPVRLIGVDAPEMRDSARLERELERSRLSRTAMTAMGRAARDFAVRRLLGKRVTLELDVERQDGYGRLLAYVWLSDGTLFNAELVEAGYARPYTVPPNVRHAARLRALGAEARKQRRGLWKDHLEALAPRRETTPRGPRASPAPDARTPPAPRPPGPIPPAPPEPLSPAPGARRSPS